MGEQQADSKHQKAKSSLFSKMRARRSSSASSVPSHQSHITILRPRDSVSLDAFSSVGAVMLLEDKELWKRRARFFFRTLCFALGLGNIWRYPRYAVITDNAIYTYLYIIYSALFGTALLIFEVSMGQYRIKGFSKIFAVCPLLEGTALSIVLYCIVSNMFYNMFSVYSMMYLYTSFYNVKYYTMCRNVSGWSGCRPLKLQNQSNSAEYVYFCHNIVKGMENPPFKEYSWRNACLLVMLWLIICMALVFGVAQMHQVYISIVIFIIVTLVITSITSLSADGAIGGMSRMWVPDNRGLTKVATWVYPFEQMVVSFGFGMGPYLTFWSHTKFKAWGQLDCILITAITVISSLLSEIIMFSALGVLAHERHKTVTHVMRDANANTATVQVHILFTQLFHRFASGLGNFIMFLFYLMLIVASLYTAVECLQMVLLYIFDFKVVRKVSWNQAAILICLVGFGLANILCTKHGYEMMDSTDRIFIASALLIIVSCELAAIMYFYGMKNYCDDIEFLLGFIPNYYFQVTWLISPVVFLVFTILSLYVKGAGGIFGFDVGLYCFTIVGILLPILIYAFYKCILSCKYRNLQHLTLPGSEHMSTPSVSFQGPSASQARH